MGKKKLNPEVTIVDKPKTINVEYQLLVTERDDLLEAEKGYKRRIEEVEKEKVDLLQSFDILYNENLLLRSKLDAPDGVGIESVESYNAVSKDRDHLREANRAYKRRIKQLEDDATAAKKEFDSLNTKHQLVTQKAKLEVEYATKNRDEKISDLEKENDDLSEKQRKLLKEKEQYEYRISEMDKERNEMQNKYDFIVNSKHELQLRCDVLQADREKLKEKVLDLEAAIPDPEQKIKEEQHFLGLQGQVAALQVANKDSSIQIHKLKEEIRELNKLKKAKVETVDRASSVLVDEEDELQRKTEFEKQAQMVEELEQSKQRGIRILKENDKLKSDKAELESRIANTELENTSLKEELNHKKTELENMTTLIQGSASLSQDYNIIQDKLNDLAAAKQVLEKELLQEKRNAKLKMIELNKDLEKSEQNCKTVQKQHSKVEHEATKLQYENEGLVKVTEAQALELRNMKSQLEQVQSMLEDKNLKYEEMKTSEREALQELQQTNIQFHTVSRELDNLKKEKAGSFGILKHEMETAKTERQEESEQFRKEAIRLREEVKQLKQYEFKITTMDAEIRRLMNRLRMTERFKMMQKVKSEKSEKSKEDSEREDVKELKRKHREMEKEKMAFLQERRQWEILKEKYADLQMNNKRLVEENKRVRGELDGTAFKIDTLEKRFKNMNSKVAEIKAPGKVQKAVYVDKPVIASTDNSLVAKYAHLMENSNDKTHTYHLKAARPKHVKFKDEIGLTSKPKKESFKKSTEHKKADKKPRTKAKAKTQELPQLSGLGVGLSYGKGYKELHKDRYQMPPSLALL